jgi:large subunit ribosomal protein L1
MAHGKNYINVTKDKDPMKVYSVEDGVATTIASSFAKFDESIDIAVKLGVDPRHADQMVRSTLVLPNGTGRTERVLVFAKGDKIQEALDAGADYAGGDDLVEKIQGGWLDFEKCIACPDMMGVVGKIGRVLGPRSLMPNAKLGTVTFDVARVVGEVKSGKVDFRVDKAGIIHAMLGKVSFGEQKVRENVLAFIDKLIQLKPSSAKGIYLKGVTISTTMGPGLKLDTADLRALVK